MRDEMDGRVQTFTQAETSRLLRVTADHVNGARDHVIIALALATGLRQFEIEALNFGDLFKAGQNLPRKRVRLRVYKTSNSRAEQQVVTLNDRIREKLLAHREWMERAGFETGPDDPVFCSNRKQRIADRTIRHMFGLWQERASIDRPLPFHSLRHTACTNVWRATHDMRLTQMFARHADIRSTMRYTHPSEEDLEAGVKNIPC